MAFPDPSLGAPVRRAWTRSRLATGPRPRSGSPAPARIHAGAVSLSSLVLFAMFVAPVSLEAQQQEAEAVSVSLAAIEGLQAHRALPADAGQLRAIRIEREYDTPARRDLAEARHAFDRQVPHATGATREAEGPSAPECEHRSVGHPDQDGVLRTHWMSRCELPGGLVPVSFRVAGMDRGEARAGSGG